MKRTTFAVSLAGAGLIAAAMATPAFAQATTYPEGTDCSAIQNSASQLDCTTQMNESRQNPAPGSNAPDPDGTGNIQSGAPNAPDTNGTNNAPTDTGTRTDANPNNNGASNRSGTGVNN